MARYCGRRHTDRVEHLKKPVAWTGEAKAKWSLLPWDALKAVAELMTRTERDHPANDWAIRETKEKLADSLQRHLTEWRVGIEVDPTTSCYHLAHVAAKALMLLALEIRS